MKLARTLTFSLLLLAGTICSAQFYSYGDDPGRLRWYSITSPHFKIIYPEGGDSLARAYGLNLEKNLVPVGNSIGYVPNAKYRRPMPVVLHTMSAQANGSVAWAPRRMDLKTGPDARGTESLEWITDLTLHESRHVAQMQFANDRGYRLFGYLTGELFAGAMAAVYPGPAFLEGDAVVTETALSRMGRGRSADFLEYYRASFAEGDFRSWYRWRWGSQRFYTPDHYKAGYLLVAGARYLYNRPMFTAEYYSNIFSRKGPFPMFNLQKIVKNASGKGFRESWKEIMSAQQELWERDMAARGPFPDSRQITPYGRMFTEYLSPVIAGDDIVAVRKGKDRSPELARVSPDGKTRFLGHFSSSGSDLQYSEATGRLYWSENVPDIRWSLASSSRIISSNPDGRHRKTLTRKGRFFNPAPSPDGKVLAVSEYDNFSHTGISMLDAESGAILKRFPAPDSLQVVEAAWIDGELVASGVSRGGFGLYYVEKGYKTLLEASPAKIKQLRSTEGRLLFVSDRTGVNELYGIAADGALARLSNNRIGASDFIFYEQKATAMDGIAAKTGRDSIIFSALTARGRMLYRSSPVILSEAKDLFLNGEGPSPWPIADRLSEQETAIATSNPSRIPPEAEISSPKRYRKALHLIKIHSWAPAYIDYDDVSSLSLENFQSVASLGAMMFFQNDLGTAYGSLGYSAKYVKTEDLTPAHWNGSLHGKFTYSGLYPVFELSADLGERNAWQYSLRTSMLSRISSSSLFYTPSNTPRLSGNAKVYVPLKFSGGGWSRGLIPQTNLNFSNDILDEGEVLLKYYPVIGENGGQRSVFAGKDGERNVPLTRLTSSIRAYSVLERPSSCIYPRWGAGAEAGYSFRPGLTETFTPAFYAYLYGYVPGLLRTHGVKWTATYQSRGDGLFEENYIKMLPRGMTSNPEVSQYLISRFPAQYKATVDYALPFLPLDWDALGPVAYMKNFELTVHLDFCRYDGKGRISDGNLYCAGADLTLRLGNLLWIPYDTRIGLSYNYNGGSLWERMEKGGVSADRHCLSAVFTVDL